MDKDKIIDEIEKIDYKYEYLIGDDVRKFMDLFCEKKYFDAFKVFDDKMDVLISCASYRD